MRAVARAMLLLLLVLPSAALAQDGKPVRGVASVYALKLIGRRTADGEHLDRVHRTAAHRSLPFGTIIEVTNRRNGRTALIRINDRGPYRRRFVIDLSIAAAAALGMRHNSSAPIEYRVVEAAQRKVALQRR